MTNIKEIADNYQKEYGFMALNATKLNAIAAHKMHAHFICDELHLVHDELVTRGVKEIKSREEYETLVKENGLPAFFQKEENKKK